jgi:hypothetical protein
MTLRWPLTAATAIALAAPTAARADSREDCANASENGQRARQAGKLREARELFLACSRDACPSVVKHDCNDWLVEVERSLPSIVVDARDEAGHDLANVKVVVDGVTVASRLDGRPIFVDPGPHAMRYEREDGEGSTDQIIVREGEKMRTLTVRFGSSLPARPSESPLGPAPPRSAESHISSTAVVLGGIAAVSLGTFTVLAIAGQSRFDTCADTRTCSASVKDGLRVERAIAWSALAAGVVSLGLATWFVVARR